METKVITKLSHFDIKSIDGHTLNLSGYASVFNHIDQHGDIICHGAFADSIKSHNNDSNVKLLWQHNQDYPIGIIKSLHEDKYGLKVNIIINTDIKRGKNIESLIKQGAVNSFSIGFKLLESYLPNDYKQSLLDHDNITKCYDEIECQRIITKVKLLEISLVTLPANDKAKIDGIIPTHISQNSKQNYKVPYFNNTVCDLSQPIYKSIENNLLLPDKLEHEHKSLQKFMRTGSVEQEYITKNSNPLHISTEDNFSISHTLYKNIITQIESISPLYSISSKETISSSTMDVFIEEGYFNTGWGDDNTLREKTNSPDLKKKMIKLHEMYACPYITQRYLDDSSINISEWLVKRIVSTFARIQNQAFLHGDGNNKPYGILPYCYSDRQNKIASVTTGKSKQISFDDIINLIHSLDDSYLANATFIVHQKTLSLLYQLKDNQGRYIWQPAISNAIPETLLGIPIVCCNDMPYTFEKGKCLVLLGDFKRGYQIINNSSGISVQYDPYSHKPYVQFYIRKRIGGDVIDYHAIKSLICSE